MKFKISDKVVCVDPTGISDPWRFSSLPEKGKTYVVRNTFKLKNGGTGLCLVGIEGIIEEDDKEAIMPDVHFRHLVAIKRENEPSPKGKGRRSRKQMIEELFLEEAAREGVELEKYLVSQLAAILLGSRKRKALK